MSDYYAVAHTSSGSPPLKRRAIDKSSVIVSDDDEVNATMFAQLDDTQRTTFDAIVHERRSTFITGSAGKGKSFLLQCVVRALRARDLNVAVTASTGRAAVELNMGATTLHNVFALGDTGNHTVDYYVRRLSQRKLEKHAKRLRSLDVLIVDEVSMINSEFFDKIASLAAHIRGRPRTTFGGLQLVVVGDFAQLPPVEGRYCFHSTAWQMLSVVHCDLLVHHRQVHDRAYAELLDRARFACLTREDIVALRSRLKSRAEIDSLGVSAVHLYTRNRLADAHNASALARLGDACAKHTYHVEIDVEPRNAQTTKHPTTAAVSRAIASARAWLERAHVSLSTTMCVGARVMLTRNVDVAKGLANGVLGTIVRFVAASNKHDTALPVVQFDRVGTHTLHRERWKFEATHDFMGYFEAMPLQLAWAMSVHRAQGITIDGTMVTALGSDDVFSCAQAYVALSRVRTMSSLYLLRFTSSMVYAHSEVVRFYNEE